MIIYVHSHIPYIQVKNQYIINDEQTIKHFLEMIGVNWDYDVLVILNKEIVIDKNKVLVNGDIIELLIPISGG